MEAKLLCGHSVEVDSPPDGVNPKLWCPGCNADVVVRLTVLTPGYAPLPVAAVDVADLLAGELLYARGQRRMALLRLQHFIAARPIYGDERAEFFRECIDAGLTRKLIGEIVGVSPSRIGEIVRHSREKRKRVLARQELRRMFTERRELLESAMWNAQTPQALYESERRLRDDLGTNEPKLRLVPYRAVA